MFVLLRWSAVSRALPCQGDYSPASQSEDLSSIQKPVHITYVVNEVAREQILRPILRFSSISIIQPMLHTDFYISYQNTRASSCKTAKVAMLFEISEKFDGKYSNIDFFYPQSSKVKNSIWGTSFKNSWFQAFDVFWMLNAFFWAIPRRLNVICRRFGTFCLFHLHSMKIKHVEKFPDINKLCKAASC
jgi:hypothetical protein